MCFVAKTVLMLLSHDRVLMLMCICLVLVELRLVLVGVETVVLEPSVRLVAGPCR